MIDAFENADYYDCRGDERFTHESPEECIEHHLDSLMEPNGDVGALIATTGPIEVAAYVRNGVTDHSVDNWATSLAAHLLELFGEEYGDPDGESDDIDDAALAIVLKPIIRAALADVTVWHCSKSGSRTYQPDEVAALMREHRPEWFEGPAQ
jgi:hypothetical protein